MLRLARSLVSPHHFANRSSLSLSAWDATVNMASVYSPIWPACWVECPDRSRRSPSPAVQNIWDVYIQEVSFVPREVREQLFTVCDTTDVDASWRIWSREVEASLARACLTAGFPALSNPGSYVGRSQLSLRTKRLGGSCRDRIYRMDRADDFDVTNSGFFVNSSLAPVLRFRRRFVSVSNVLEGIKLYGFTDTKSGCFFGTYGMLSLRWSPPALSPRLNLGPIGFLPTSMGFTSGPWTPWLSLMSLSRKSFITGRLPGCKLGPIGLGKTSPLIRTSGFGRILSLHFYRCPLSWGMDAVFSSGRAPCCLPTSLP